ncbi:hypothetical protein RZS08_54135, partial [Arthrospira platensis SPKY1]|nr:hypothetical protein [Arthrospira platensis SPKY1]
WEKDIELLSKARHFLVGKYRMIIAPHEISAKQIKNIRRSFFDCKTVLYSETDDALQNSDILILDTIGILSRLYRYANIAYIGGGFGKGIHNTLEPGSYGI